MFKVRKRTYNPDTNSFSAATCEELEECVDYFCEIGLRVQCGDCFLPKRFRFSIDGLTGGLSACLNREYVLVGPDSFCINWGEVIDGAPCGLVDPLGLDAGLTYLYGFDGLNYSLITSLLINLYSGSLIIQQQQYHFSQNVEPPAPGGCFELVSPFTMTKTLPDVLAAGFPEELIVEAV
jgi:hypothetical protein